MTEVAYDFAAYRGPVMEKARNFFGDAVKRGENIDLQALCLSALEQTGLPPHCILASEVLAWLEDIYHLKFLQRPLAHPRLQELILHSSQVFQIQAQSREYGQIEHLSEDDFQMALEVFAQKHHQTWNYTSPFCSFQAKIFGQTYRVTLCHACLTPGKNSKAFFRALRPRTFSLEDFGMNERAMDFFL